MRPGFRYARRTLVGPWLVFPAAALEAANFAQRGMPWRGEGMWTVEWFAIALFVIGPLCAGVAAVDASRLSRPGNIHLVLSTPRPSLPYLRAAAWCAGPVVAVHLLALTGAVVVGGVRNPSIGWLAMLAGAGVQAVAIFWYAALGSALGRFFAPLLAGLAGAVVGLAATLTMGDSLSGPSFRLLAFGSSTVSRLGLAYNAGYLAAQVAILIVTAALLLLLPIRTRGSLRVPTLQGAGFAVGVLAILALLPTWLPANRLVLRPKPPTLCAGSAPQVCLFTEHRRFERVVDDGVQTLARAASAAGYDALVPLKVLESSRSYLPGGPGIRSFSPTDDLYKSGRLPVTEMALALVQPLHCPQLRAAVPPSDKFWSRLFSVTETWLDIAKVEREGQAPFPTKHLTPAEVRDIMDDFARCDLDGGA